MKEKRNQKSVQQLNSTTYPTSGIKNSRQLHPFTTIKQSPYLSQKKSHSSENPPAKFEVQKRIQTCSFHPWYMSGTNESKHPLHHRVAAATDDVGGERMLLKPLNYFLWLLAQSKYSPWRSEPGNTKCNFVGWRRVYLWGAE